jgi:hypothetical protein
MHWNAGQKEDDLECCGGSFGMLGVNSIIIWKLLKDLADTWEGWN